MRWARWLPWLALAAVVVAALAVGASGGGDETVEERVERVASGVRCPTCRSQSAADSDATAARAIRTEIERRARAGETDAEIRAFLVSRYGKDVLLRPEGTGVAALVWILPVVGLVAAAGGLAVAFRRWRPRREPAVTDEDRRLVDEAMRP